MTRPSLEHWAKKFFEKITPKHVQNTFGHFWGRFCAFLEFWNFFDFFWKFSFGHFWGRFWAFWSFETFLIFLKKFEDSTLHGTLGKNFFWKKHPKTSSKHVWTLLGSNLGIFGILKVFWYFLKLFQDSTLLRTLGKKFFSKKLTLNLFKTRLDNFGNDFGLFWNFEIFFDFENFRLDTFGDDFGHFGSLKLFWFFWENSKTRPSMEQWAKKNFEKITLKHLRNTFGLFWGRFWAFL